MSGFFLLSVYHIGNKAVQVHQIAGRKIVALLGFSDEAGGFLRIGHGHAGFLMQNVCPLCLHGERWHVIVIAQIVGKMGGQFAAHIRMVLLVEIELGNGLYKRYRGIAVGRHNRYHFLLASQVAQYPDGCQCQQYPERPAQWWNGHQGTEYRIILRLPVHVALKKEIPVNFGRILRQIRQQGFEIAVVLAIQ